MRATGSAPLLLLVLMACQPQPPEAAAAGEPPRPASSPPSAADTPRSDRGGGVTTLARMPGEPPEAQMEALLEGTLVAEDGCLWIQPEAGPRYAVLWPGHVELEPGAAPPAVRDVRSGARVRVGGEIRVGGGELPDQRAEAIAGSLPPGCGRPLWLASGIVPA